MPTYEYRCKACGHELEIVQSFSDDALTTCPSCHAAELRKVFGSVGIAFKGSGFYKNDSRSKTSASSSTSPVSTTSNDSGSGGSTSTSDTSTSTSTTPAKPAKPAKPAATTSEAKSA